MVSASEARDLILRESFVLGPETISLRESLARTLCHPVLSPLALPSFDNSAMDGFALRSVETQSASEQRPVSLAVIGTTAAGDLPSSLRPGEAVRIMTGAPIPSGADAVVPFEEVAVEKGRCLISNFQEGGRNIRRAGEDVLQGAEVLRSGEKISSRTVALLAALGIDRVEVFRKPRVCVLSTGSELVEVGENLLPGKIYNSNGPALEAALQELGITPQVLKTAHDTEVSLEAALKNSDADVLVTVGGVSAGDFDLVPKVLQALGSKIIFHKVAIKPGKPLLFATSEKGGLIFGLPGNPVSALVVFDQFIRPALLKMMGSSPLRSRRIAVAEQDLKASRGKEDYFRGLLSYRDGMYYVRSAGAQGSAHMKSLAVSNALVVIPEDVEKVSAGERVEVEMWRDAL